MNSCDGAIWTWENSSIVKMKAGQLSHHFTVKSIDGGSVTVSNIFLFYFFGFAGQEWDMTGIVLDSPFGVVKDGWEVRNKMQVLRFLHIQIIKWFYRCD